MCTALKLEMGPPSAFFASNWLYDFQPLSEPSEVSVLYKGQEREYHPPPQRNTLLLLEVLNSPCSLVVVHSAPGFSKKIFYLNRYSYLAYQTRPVQFGTPRAEAVEGFVFLVKVGDIIVTSIVMTTKKWIGCLPLKFVGSTPHWVTVANKGL